MVRNFWEMCYMWKHVYNKKHTLLAKDGNSSVVSNGTIQNLHLPGKKKINNNFLYHLKKKIQYYESFKNNKGNMIKL